MKIKSKSLQSSALPAPPLDLAARSATQFKFKFNDAKARKYNCAR